MNLTKFKLLFHTIIHLRWQQVYYRVYYAVRNRFFNRGYAKILAHPTANLTWESPIQSQNSYLKENTFSFLNIAHNFDEKIDWNHAAYGKLWTYNLNYFDFLLQENIDVNDGIYLINNYIDNFNNCIDGREPYPTSLRGINWIKFLSQHTIKDAKIDQQLYNDYQRLYHNLEYHLLGNHLLENAFSLLFAAYYFKDDKFYAKARTLLKRELTEQLHSDGGHFELSPMYHQIILHRLLDCIQLIQLNPKYIDGNLMKLEKAAGLMCNWLETMTFANDEIPLFNDSAKGIAAPSSKLLAYAHKLRIKPDKKKLRDSGYRVFQHLDLQLITDVGQVGPSYQPGHAHADTLGFVLYYNKAPFLIDPGVSTYEIGNQRSLERATKFHNTVTPLDESNSSQVWSGFRVAKRAKVKILHDDAKHLVAEHNGFKKVHQRSFSCRDNNLVITDLLTQSEAKAFFHLAPGIAPVVIVNKMQVRCNNVLIHFSDCKTIEIEDYECPNGYNQWQSAKKIVVLFYENLISTFELNS